MALHFSVELFRSCRDARCLSQLHSLITKTGLIYDVVLAAKLNNLYAIYAPLSAHRKLFDETPQRTTGAWNSILRRYRCERRYRDALYLFPRMLSTDEPDEYTVATVLKACCSLRALQFGKCVHSFVKKSQEISSNLFVGSSLIDLYWKCGRPDEALRVFEDYDVPDVVLWTTMVTGYEQNGKPQKALEFFARMVMEGGIIPDPVLLVSVVSGCAKLSQTKPEVFSIYGESRVCLNAGKSVHGFMIRNVINGGLSLLNALLNLYGKMGYVNGAANLFAKMEEKDVISWGSMISCYAHNRSAIRALELLDEMMNRGVEPNEVIVISALQACEATGNLELGKRLHDLSVQKDFELDVMVATALIDMYMNCSSPDDAVELFQRMGWKDAVSWSAILCGCVQNEMAYEAMGFFREMLCSEVHPDADVMVKMLTACSEVGVLQQACCLHGYLIRGGFDKNTFVGASLIDSYAKCGSLGDAVKVFRMTTDRDVVVWSSMFAGYGFHGKGRETLKLFSHMAKNSGISPNSVTFLSILSACSHAGLLEEGIRLFDMMVNVYKLTPESKHYGIMVDLLGRTGQLDHAMDIINESPLPVGAHVWGALLGASRIHQNTEMAEVAAKNLLQLDPSHAGYYILLSNMYAAGGKWDSAAKVRSFVKDTELKKVPGESILELKNQVCRFTANDRYHPSFDQIHALLMVLETNMREDVNSNLDFRVHDAEGGL